VIAGDVAVRLGGTRLRESETAIGGDVTARLGGPTDNGFAGTGERTCTDSGGDGE